MDPYDGRPKPRSPLPPPPEPKWIASDPSNTEYVLTLGEAAARLGMSRSELEAMIERGQVEALQGEFIRVIRTREVKRLQQQRS